MINFLRKVFIKDFNNIKDKDVRLAHGVLASIIGIVSNLLVFISKLVIGIISFSISIISDAINNLSDMATSIVALIGFKVAKKKPDEKHPFGHERMEYISGLLVSLVIIIVGVALLASSIYKMISYKEEGSFLSNLFIVNVIILSVSILIKLWQAYSYYRIGTIISSISLKANYRDSLNDVLTTSLILIALIIEYVLSLNGILIPFSLDGLLGILVSMFIIFTGVSLLKEESNPLIGTKLNKEMIDNVVNEIKKHKEILNYHDIMCHTYGESKCYMTIHLEVDKNNTLEYIHNVIDIIEYSIKNEYGIELTVHIDPIDLSDKELFEIKDKIESFLKDNYKDVSIHDIRIIRRGKKPLVLFEMVTPFNSNDTEIKNRIHEQFNNKYEFNIEVEHPYY